MFVLFFVAMLASVLGTIAGFGGGIFIVPIMVMGFGVPIEGSIGVTALSLFPASLYSTFHNYRKQAIDVKLLVALEIPTVIGAFVGAQCTRLLPTQPLEMIFAAFLMILSYKMLKPSSPHSVFNKVISTLNSKKPILKKKDYHVSLWAAGFFGLLSGVIAGLFGIGGGILKTPVMIKVFNVPVKVATATALGMIVFTSLSSGLTHYVVGHVDHVLFLYCGGGFLAGAVIGGKLNVKIKDNSLKKVIAVSIFLAGLATITHVGAKKWFG
ncbi:MAG: sulfite exporter TauE/SafE family protein [Deltaproteobacteria bacterium]|nr:sulfite exporter TauE/SafE family protein [Deltaproteobacteria bacterium]